MKLSAPIYYLKRKARLLAREQKIPLHQALDRIARDEGYGDWSLLAARMAASRPAARLLARLEPGELLLLGGRPGEGKSLLSLELALEAVKSARRAKLFTLEDGEAQVLDRLGAIAADREDLGAFPEVDCSDAISADYIIASLDSAPPGTLVIVDYLQLLDQNRTKPPVAVQIDALKRFAQERRLIIVIISQIDRSFDASKKPFPDLDDLRLPNPLDVRLFDKACFLSGGEARLQAVG